MQSQLPRHFCSTIIADSLLFTAICKLFGVYVECVLNACWMYVKCMLNDVKCKLKATVRCIFVAAAGNCSAKHLFDSNCILTVLWLCVDCAPYALGVFRQGPWGLALLGKASGLKNMSMACPMYRIFCNPKLIDAPDCVQSVAAWWTQSESYQLASGSFPHNAFK